VHFELKGAFQVQAPLRSPHNCPSPRMRTVPAGFIALVGDGAMPELLRWADAIRVLMLAAPNIATGKHLGRECQHPLGDRPSRSCYSTMVVLGAAAILRPGR
jgi:hypothetical protein